MSGDVSKGTSGSSGRGSQRRVSPEVGLALLEVIRSQDHPEEVLKDEDPSVTMPRRLGLSEVVTHQIARYRHDAKKGIRSTEDEVADLFRLVTRRPDSPEVFFEVGVRLSGQPESPPKSWKRFLPKKLAYASARRTVRRRLRRLFGKFPGGFAAGPFVFEAGDHILIKGDPGGEACHLVSGICERNLAPFIRSPELVVHVACRARGDDVCRWTAVPAMTEETEPGA